MGIDRKEIKRAARETVRLARPRPIGVTLVFVLISYAVPLAVGLLFSLALLACGAYDGGGGVLPVVLQTVLLALFNAVLGFGYTAYTLRLCDGEPAGCGTLFAGFPWTGPVLLLNLILFGLCMVWYCAVMLPTFFLTSLVGYALRTVSVGAASVVMFAGLLGGAALLALMLMRYVFSALALADQPELGAMEALRASRALLRGRSGEMLCFYLSFAGWYLLMFSIYLAPPLIVFAVEYATGMWIANMVVSVSMLVGLLAAAPLALWLFSYVGIATAGYYRALNNREWSASAEAGPANGF